MSNVTSVLHKVGRFHTQEEIDARLDSSWRWLGLSEGSWVLLGSCIGGVLLSFLAILTAVEMRTARVRAVDDESEDEDPKLLSPRGLQIARGTHAPDPGYFQRAVFCANRYGNNFALNTDLAVRGAVVCVFCGATFVFPWLYCWQFRSWDMSYVVVMLAFTLWKDLGSTVALAWSGFGGTMLAVANCWLMFGLYPHGFDGDNHDAVRFGWVDFLVFSWLVINLDFATNAKMFALSWQAYFTMCFLNPQDATVFSEGFSNISLTCAESAAVMGSILGIAAALLCSLFPTTISALGMAQDLAVQIAWSHGELLVQLADHGTAKQGQQETTTFFAELKQLRKQTLQLEAYLSNSWWECFDLGRTGRARARMGKLCPVLHALSDWAQAVLMAIESADLQERENGQSASLVARLRADLLQHCNVVANLLRVSARIAAEGHSDYNEDELKDLLMSLETTERQLAVSCFLARKQLKSPGSFGFSDTKHEGFSAEKVPEFALAFSFSGYARQVNEYVTNFLEEGDDNAGSGPFSGFFFGILALPVLPMDWKSVEHYLDCLKLMATYVGCFLLGRHGIGGVVPGFNAVPPGTISYLIFSGGNAAAAVKKNADRFMGIGVGSMLGQITLSIGCTYSYLHEGSLLGRELLLIPVFFMEFGALYTYFSSESFSYIGLLVTCFFAEHAFGTCSPPDQASLSNYKNLVSQLIAISIATLVDGLTDRSISHEAVEHMAEFGEVMEHALSHFTESPPGRDLLFHRDEGFSLLTKARFAGASAAVEPRILRLPWRTELWENIHSLAEQAWHCLALIEYLPLHQREGELEAARRSLLKSPAFCKELQEARERAGNALELALSLLKQDRLDSPNAGTRALQQKLMRSHEFSFQDQTARVVAETISGLPAQGGPLSSLSEDYLGEIAMILTMTEHLVARLGEIEKCLLQQPELWQEVA